MTLAGATQQLYRLSWRIPFFGKLASSSTPGYAAFILHHQDSAIAQLTKDTKLEKPYSKGKSLELLQGFAPYHEPGTVSARTDVPYAEGGELWETMKGWISDPDYIWKEAPQDPGLLDLGSRKLD